MTPFNLHAKRSIEHIVILIGRVDNHARDNGDSIIYAFSRNFQDWVASTRGKEIYSAHLVLPPRHASVAILLRKVISFFSLPVSFASLHFPVLTSFLSFRIIVRSIHVRRNASANQRSRTRDTRGRCVWSGDNAWYNELLQFMIISAYRRPTQVYGFDVYGFFNILTATLLVLFDSFWLTISALLKNSFKKTRFILLTPKANYRDSFIIKHFWIGFTEL